MRRTLILVAAAVAGLAFVDVGDVDGQRPGVRQQVAPPPGGGAERDSLEARVRVRMAQVLRTQLGLTDVQMRRLTETNRRFEGRRRTLLEEEREVRMGLRDELGSGDTTRGAQVNALLDRMLTVQRQRFELLEAEQKELATFLTPVQRARYFGMEEQIRRRVEEMRAQRMPADPPPGRARPLPQRRPPAATRRPPQR